LAQGSGSNPVQSLGQRRPVAQTMAARFFVALASALLLVAAQVPHSEANAVDIASQGMKSAAAAAASAAMDAEKVMESAEKSSAMHSLQELRGLNLSNVIDKAASWHSADELEAQQEKVLSERRKRVQNELSNFVEKLEALPSPPTNTSTVQAKQYLASARKADEELSRVDKAQVRAMHHAFRLAEHAANAQVKSLERSVFRSAHVLRKEGSKLEEATRKSKSVPENVYEGAQDKIESTSEQLSSKAESVAERFQGNMERNFDVLADQVDDRIDAMRQRSRERHEKTRATLSKLAETRVSKKEGARGMSFLEASTSSSMAKGSASFMAGLLASMVGVFAVIKRHRFPPVPVSEAPLLG